MCVIKINGPYIICFKCEIQKHVYVRWSPEPCSRFSKCTIVHILSPKD